MNEIGLKCEVRKRRRIREKEIKNTSINIENLVTRDYDNLSHSETILATDVTYIKSPKDLEQNHVFLSALIDHRSKVIVSYNLSTNNNTDLVIKHLKDLNYDQNVIIHSDHGCQYSSKQFTNLIKSKGWKQSMSRVGNCLDNREIKHWFGVLKTELIYNLDFSEITYADLKQKIDEYIFYYNNIRIQQKLN